MRTKYFIAFVVLNFAVACSLLLIAKALADPDSDKADNKLNVQYPVAELGNCRDEAACRAYCDKTENIKLCLGFAEKHNLMPKEEIEAARKFAALGRGPGGCKTKESCDEFCGNILNIDECVSFAEKNGLMPKDELEEAKKVQAAIKKGVKPPSCRNKKECDLYCESADHMEECLAFAEAAGFMEPKELEDAKKVLSAVRKGVKPPPCRGKEECDVYCGNPDNMEACLTFAEAAGFMTGQELEDSKKMLGALRKGVKPPKCRGKEECDIYCATEEHFEECANFAEAAGFMSAKDAEMARKTKGKGPGGCRGKEECDAFCNNPDNQETCFNFAKKYGLIPEEDLRRMEENKQKLQETLNQAPAEVSECLNASLGSEMIDKLKSGAVMPPKEVGDKMRGCFEKMARPPEGENRGESGNMPPQGQGFRGGPGGCKNPEECENYCQTHEEECKNFGPTTRTPLPPGEGGGGTLGPGTAPIECQGENCPGVRPEKERLNPLEQIQKIIPDLMRRPPEQSGQQEGREPGEFIAPPGGVAPNGLKPLQEIREPMPLNLPKPVGEGIPGGAGFPSTGIEGSQPLQPIQLFRQPEEIKQFQPPPVQPLNQPSPENATPPQPSTQPLPGGFIQPKSLTGLILNLFDLLSH